MYDVTGNGTLVWCTTLHNWLWEGGRKELLKQNLWNKNTRYSGIWLQNSIWCNHWWPACDGWCMAIHKYLCITTKDGCLGWSITFKLCVWLFIYIWTDGPKGHLFYGSGSFTFTLPVYLITNVCKAAVQNEKGKNGH